MATKITPPNAYYSSDYAGLSCENAVFYYGYEYSICDECGNKNNGEFCENHPDAGRQWCFTAKFADKEIVIPFKKLGCKDMGDVNDCLLKGIGWVLTRYTIAV